MFMWMLNNTIIIYTYFFPLMMHHKIKNLRFYKIIFFAFFFVLTSEPLVNELQAQEGSWISHYSIDISFLWKHYIISEMCISIERKLLYLYYIN